MYNPNIPLATDFLADSQGQIKTNFSQLNAVYGVDHSPYTSATNIGYHQDIHIIKRTGNPTNVAGTQIVFTKDYTPDATGATVDTQLFTLTGANTLSQLSGRLQTSDGWVWIAGMLLQWGFVILPGTSNPTGTVTFKDRVAGAIPFPNSCFAINLTLRAVANTSSANTLAVLGNPTATQFQWMFTGSTSYASFYWTAIGY
jgi:hypothetical protein